MKAYTLALSSGATVRMEAASAAEAIEKVLWEFRGQSVKRCYQGFDGQDARMTQGQIGGIEFDVPAHSPVSADAKKPVHRRAKDQTEVFSFFSDGR